MAAVPEQVEDINSRLLETLKTPGAISQQWSQCSDYRALQSQVHGFLRDAVPLIFRSPKVFSDAEDGNSYDKLLYALEWFIFSGDPVKAVKDLKKNDTPSSFCGRVFKVGEPNYSCRDCALDPTCVLCIDCFQASGHRNHRYKMNTSGGGGYCDCGDVEAWTSDPACDKHLPSSERDNEQDDPLKDFPEDLIKRGSYLFQILINYCNKMFNAENEEVLPEEVRPAQSSSEEDSYCTMLFNDEVHTYDQVIDALKRAVGSKQKEALELATIVDKEGRTSVRNSTFRECESAKSTIITHTSRQLKPLKVLVMHSSVVAHQDFALKLMEWLITISAQLDGLRHLVCEKLMTKASGTDDTIVECCLFRDSKLWKAARTQWHELLMSTMLLDNKYKKELAILVTKHYKRIQSDYAHDDHEHSMSVTAITVQVYTVPTMGLMLVREQSLIKVIVRSFLDITHESRDPVTGKYVFTRGSASVPVRRVITSLTDLRYVLSNKPQVWDAQVRSMVMEGLEAFLELLQAVHGMDSVVRAVGHHIEYDPEWEIGIHLNIQLKVCITLFLEWCTADKKMLINSYRSTLKAYRQTFNTMNEINVSFANHTTTCFRYEVSHRPVSIHYALVRFLAGLHVGMGKFNLSYLTEGLLPQQPIQPIEMIEEPMRVQVLVAELHAGQWRRNGYALVNQVFFYKNVKCREEMYDRDIQMLQVGASLMEPDDFILCLLNRFGLIRFLEVSGGETGHAEMQEILGPKIEIMEEFLQLLIIIICERYVVGVGEVEADAGLRREVLHQLCITSMAHSELVKNLPEDYLHETGVEKVISSLANYKKPTKVTEKGKYELKKECLKEYCPYYYHYSRTELSKSEDHHRQRLEREGVKDNGGMFIPQLPPPFCQNFKAVVKLLDSKMFICLLKVIFHRAIVSKGRLWSENLFQKALHLVGLALLEEERSLESPNPLRFTDRASRREKSLLKLLQGMVGNPKVASCGDLLNWIFKKFDEIQVSKGTVPPEWEATVQVESPAPEIDTKAEEERNRKAEQARQRREQIMAQMSAMQKKFIRGNPELFEETEQQSRDRAGSITSMDVEDVEGLEAHVSLRAVGPNKSPAVLSEQQMVTCILCQEEEKLSYSGKAMVYSTFVQRSSVLSNSRDKYLPTSVLEKYDPLFSSWDVAFGCHARTCGHVMHATCWQSFFDALVHRERRRVSRFRGELNYDISKNQFMCPLCETLSNTVLPILPPLHTTERPLSGAIPSMDEWLLSLKSAFNVQRTLDLSPKAVDKPAARVTSPSSYRKRTLSEGAATEESTESDKDGDPVDPPKSAPVLPTLICPSFLWKQHLPANFSNLLEIKKPCNGDAISQTVQDMLKTFSQAVYSIGLRVMPDSDNERIPLMSWNVCAYTIQSTEILLRVEEKPLFGALPARQCDTLRSLVRHAVLSSWLSNAANIQKYVLRLLSVFDKNDTTQLGLPQSILDIDVFTMMVSLLSSYPALYQVEEWYVGSVLSLPGPTLNLYLLRLCFTVHLLQIILLGDIQDNSDSMDEDTEVSSKDQNLADLYSMLWQLAYGSAPTTVPKPWTIQQHLSKASLPFLRWSALYFHFLTSVPHPIELEQVSPINEYELLCEYLSLPTDVAEMFDFGSNPAMNELIQGVCGKQVLKAGLHMPRHFPLKVNQLIELPLDYMEVMNDRSLYVCPKAGATQSEGRAPAMCLICGTVVCSHSYCCQVEVDGETLGACSAHALKCNEGTGIFLRVRDCVLLLMASRNNSCSYTPPYVDEYGEPDHGLRRGNPLHLSMERYSELHKMWISHDIPAEVTRRLESNNNLLNIPNI